MNDPVQSKAIAQLVRDAIHRIPPFDGMTLDVDESGIYATQMPGKVWWRVPIIAIPEPTRMFKLYEALAEIEGILQDEQGLDILLFAGDPEHASPAYAAD